MALKTIEEIRHNLTRPFHVNEVEFVNTAHVAVKQNDGKIKDFVIAGMYVNMRKVLARLDEAVGPFSWETDIYESAEGEWREKSTLTPASCCVRLTITLPDGTQITRSDAGIGKDRKSAVSDAIKRVGFQFGIGRYFYSMPKLYVPATQRGHYWNFKNSDAAEEYIKAFRKLFPGKEYEQYISRENKLSSGGESPKKTSGQPAATGSRGASRAGASAKRNGPEEVRKIKERGEILKREFADRLDWRDEDITKENVFEWIKTHIEGIKLPENLSGIFIDDEIWNAVKTAIEVDVMMSEEQFEEESGSDETPF